MNILAIVLTLSGAVFIVFAVYLSIMTDRKDKKLIVYELTVPENYRIRSLYAIIVLSTVSNVQISFYRGNFIVVGKFSEIKANLEHNGFANVELI